MAVAVKSAARAHESPTQVRWVHSGSLQQYLLRFWRIGVVTEGKLTVIGIEGQVPGTLVVWFPTRNVRLGMEYLSQAQPEMDCDFENHESCFEFPLSTLCCHLSGNKSVEAPNQSRRRKEIRYYA